MVRYFINYEDLVENNVINKNINIYSSNLFIKKKYKKGLVKFENILYFNDYNINILNFAKKLNYNKKGILMVELTKEEADKFDNLLIKKYKNINDNICEKIYNNGNQIKLIKFNDLINLSEEEIKKGTIIALMPCVNNKDYMYVSADRSKLSNEFNINERRNMLLKEGIGCDIYFHTEDEELLERCSDNLTEIEEVDFSTYKINKNKLFVLDSINTNNIIGFNSSNYYALDVLSSNSIPVYIENLSIGYKLSTSQDFYNSKGYIINSFYFDSLLKGSAINPLIKFINVYELENGIYKKTSLEDYLNDAKTLKYTKKNW